MTGRFLLGGKDGIWKQARKLVIMCKPKSTGHPPHPAKSSQVNTLPNAKPAVKTTQGDIPLGLMQTSLRSRLSRMPHGRHIKEERKEMGIGNFSLDGSSHQTGDAAFTPATLHDLHHSRANNDSHNSHNTQHTRVKQNTLCFTQKNTQPSQTCSGGHITPNPTQNRCG